MTGQFYTGHFDIWLINERQALLNSDLTRKFIPGSSTLVGWVNGNYYVQTKETFGILPVPPNVQLSSGLLPYDHKTPPKKHTYLSRKQSTRFAVLTLHTNEEKQLFSNFMQTNSVFMRAQGPDWPTAVCLWNQAANGDTIFYKVFSSCISWLLAHLQNNSSSNICSGITQFGRQT